MTAPQKQRERFGHISVITDGLWMDSYVLSSDLEKSDVYLSSLSLDKMWFEIDLIDEYLVFAVNIYSRNGNN